jgi:hypothetical protein
MFATHSLPIGFWLKIFFSFPWNYGVAYGHVLQALSCTSEWRITSRVISRFDIDATSLWWRFWTSRGARLSWSWTPSSLVLSHFSKLLHLGDLAANRPRFWSWTRNRLWRLFETENITIFAWSWIPDVGHYHWLRSSIHWLPPNNKVSYLVCTIRHILDFLQLWIITMA